MKENSHIFLCVEAKDAQVDQIIYLSEEEAAHCTKVLRLKPGDLITVIDGFGKMYNAELVLCSKNAVSAKITEILEDVYIRNYRNHVAIAPTKNIDRFEWFLEKAVEFGVDEITPLLCDHSERKVLKIDRLQKIIVSALKQSGNAIMPKLNELTPFDEAIEKIQSDVKLIAHCEPQQKTFFANNVKKHQSVTTLIGPEGDFSDMEIKMALESGYQAVSLGETRLRTETAGVSVCAFLSCINNQ